MHSIHTLRAVLLGGTLVLCGAAAASAQKGGTTITLGQTVTGALEASDPLLDDGTHYDAYRFTGRAGQRVEIRMRSEAFDAYLQLGTMENGEFRSQESDDDGGGGTDARIRFTIPAAGTYVIYANSLGEAEGDYTLSLTEGEAVDPMPTPTPIRIGQTVNGTLSATDPKLESDDTHYDLHRFTARAGQRVQVVMRSGDFDAYLAVGRVEDGELNVLESDDDGAGGSDAKVIVTLTEAGEYVIRANSLNADETGAYTLELKDLPRPVEPRAAAIRLDAAVTGELGEGDAVADDDTYFDPYVYRARAGERIVVEMSSEAFDTYLAIGRGTGAAWELLESNDDADGGEGTDSRLEFTAPAAGDYIIRANALSQGGTGAYTVRVTRAPAARGTK